MLCKFQLLYLYDQLILVAAPQVQALLVGLCSFPKQKEWDSACGIKHQPSPFSLPALPLLGCRVPGVAERRRKYRSDVCAVVGVA